MSVNGELFFFYKEIIEQNQQTRLIFDQYQLNSSDYFSSMTIISDRMTFENIDKCLKIKIFSKVYD